MTATCYGNTATSLLERPELERTAADHLWFHGWDMDWEELTEREGLKVFARAEDSTLYDVRGREYLDGLAGLFVVNVGHGRREIGEAMARQAGQIAYAASSNYTTIPTVQLAETLARITPGDLSRVFFCSGGSEAVETALKIAKQAQALRGFPKRYKIIARRGSYHGDDLRRDEPHRRSAGGVLRALHVRRFPRAIAESLSKRLRARGRRRRHHVRSLRRAGDRESGSGDGRGCHWRTDLDLERRPRSIAKLLANAARDLRPARRLPDHGRDHQRLRTHRQTLCQPSISESSLTSMTIAKGLSSGYAPIAGVVVRPSVFEGFKQEGASIGHLLTFGGHAVATAAANKNIEILFREDLVARCAEQGAYLLSQLEELRSHPSVGDVRGIGLMTCLDLVKGPGSKEPWGTRHAYIKTLGETVHNKGLLTRVWNQLHVSPPLVVTRDEIDRMVMIIDESLTEVEARFAGEIETAA